MSLRIINSEFDATLRVFERLYPNKFNLIIQFDPTMEGTRESGHIMFPEPGEELTQTFVFINANLSIYDAGIALIEQLTDVIFGDEEEVNEFAWKKTYNELKQLSEKELMVMFKELNLNHKLLTQLDENGDVFDFDDDDE